MPRAKARDFNRILRRRDRAPIGVLAVLVALLLGVPFAGVRPARAQSEDQIKAAFLFNFARYVEWPEDAFDRGDAPVRICALGASGFGEVLAEVISGKKIGPRPVEVRRLLDLSEATGCHVLFIGRTFVRSHEDAIGALRDRPIFTVSDRDGFAAAGGTANFYRADNRVRFEINPQAARNARLKVSSRLLRLAKVVNQEGD